MDHSWPLAFLATLLIALVLLLEAARIWHYWWYGRLALWEAILGCLVLLVVYGVCLAVARFLVLAAGFALGG